MRALLLAMILALPLSAAPPDWAQGNPANPPGHFRRLVLLDGAGKVTKSQRWSAGITTWTTVLAENATIGNMNQGPANDLRLTTEVVNLNGVDWARVTVVPGWTTREASRQNDAAIQHQREQQAYWKLVAEGLVASYPVQAAAASAKSTAAKNIADALEAP